MIMGLHMSLDFLVARLHLEKNYVGNVKDYARTVKHFYDTNQISNVQIIIPEPDQILLLIISATTTLYPCFYNMEEITRYPLKEFSYKNLDLLANQRQACDQIYDMLDNLFRILKPYLTKYEPNYS